MIPQKLTDEKTHSAYLKAKPKTHPERPRDLLGQSEFATLPQIDQLQSGYNEKINMASLKIWKKTKLYTNGYIPKV